MVELWAKQENTNICFFYQYYADDSAVSVPHVAL